MFSAPSKTDLFIQHFTTQSRLLMTFRKKAFKNIVGKGENAGTSIFSFSNNVFYPLQNKFHFLSWKLWRSVVNAYYQQNYFSHYSFKGLIFIMGINWSCLLVRQWRVASIFLLNFWPHNAAYYSYIVVENIVRKGEIACNKQYLLFSQWFLPDMLLLKFKMHFKMWSAICFNLDQSKTLSSGKGLTLLDTTSSSDKPDKWYFLLLTSQKYFRLVQFESTYRRQIELHFLLFPQCFPNSYYLGSLKVVIVW